MVTDNYKKYSDYKSLMLNKNPVLIKAYDIFFSKEYENVCKSICLKGNDENKHKAFYEFEEFLIKIFVSANK